MTTDDSQLHILGSQLASFMNVRKRSVQVLGETQDYLEKGRGIPVVLLHGFCCNKATWRGVMSRFPDESYRLIAPDVPAFCLSKLDPKKNYSSKYFVDWLDGFLDVLGIDQCHLLAHSTATMVGITYAARKPDRVLSLALANLPDNFMPEAGEEGGIADDFLQSLQCETGEDWYRNISAMFYRPPSIPKVMKEYNCNMLNKKLGQAQGFLDACLRWRPQLLSLAGKVECPVYLVASDHDVYAPRDFIERAQSNFRKFSYVELQKCGHMSFLEKQTDFISAYSNYLSDSRSASKSIRSA